MEREGGSLVSIGKRSDYLREEDIELVISPSKTTNLSYYREESMIERLIRATKIALNIEKGRHLTVFDDDTFLVSYPRSGNTWTRFLIASLSNRLSATTFISIGSIIPDIHDCTNRRLKHLSRPRILKSHEYFDPRYKKVIYIIRDPRDVSVSYYHHWIKFYGLPDDYPVDSFVARFIRGDLDAFGSWGENVGSWLGARQSDENFLLVRYEDLLQSTQGELEKIAAFLSWNVSQSDIHKAIAFCSADNMRKLERNESRAVPFLRKSRMDKSFVRTARAGGWKSELSPQAARLIESAWGKLLATFHYL